MAKIIQHDCDARYVEVVNDKGERLFCHVSAERAQRLWDQDARDSGLGHLADFAPLPITPCKCNA